MCNYSKYHLNSRFNKNVEHLKIFIKRLLFQKINRFFGTLDGLVVNFF